MPGKRSGMQWCRCDETIQKRWFTCMLLFINSVVWWLVFTRVSLRDPLLFLIQQWSAWQPSKSQLIKRCKYKIVSRKKTPTLPDNPLQLLEDDLERVDKYKHMGVLLTNDLSWSPHIGNICAKVRHVLGLLYRRFYGTTSQNSYRPHMEYVCQVWDPHLGGKSRVCRNLHSNWHQQGGIAVTTSSSNSNLPRKDALNSNWD